MISSNSILTCILIIYWFRFVTLQPLLDSIDDIIKIRPLESDEELISIAESEHENLVKRQINELKNDWPSVMDALLLEERMGRATTKDMDEDLQLHKTSDEFYLSTESNLLLKRDIDQKKHKRERRRETRKYFNSTTSLLLLYINYFCYRQKATQHKK